MADFLVIDDLSHDPAFRSGLTHHMQGRLREAENAYRAVLSTDPLHFDAGQMLGVLAYQTGHFGAAISILSDLARRDTERGDVHTNLALALEFAGRFEDAEAANRRALSLPIHPIEALGNHANVLRQLWRLPEAKAEFVEALRLSPGNVGLHYNHALCLLAEGEFASGWPEFEWRNALMQAGSGPSDRPWDGREAKGAVLRVRSEQGLGDTLLFSRFLMRIPPSMRLELDVQPQVARLMAASFPQAQILSTPTAPKPDFEASLLSLPALLGARIDPRRTERYLTPPEAGTGPWRERVQGLPGLRVGLAWAGGSRPGQAMVEAVDARRSLTLRRLDPVLNTPGVSFICLQKDRRDSVAERGAPTELYDWTSEIVDLADTAALIDELDLVISVDTAVAHLTGALGRPVWVLSRYDSCWRWPADGRPEWYGGARQFRQPAPGSWEEPIAAAAKALGELAAQTVPSVQR